MPWKPTNQFEYTHPKKAKIRFDRTLEPLNNGGTRTQSVEERHKVDQSLISSEKFNEEHKRKALSQYNLVIDST